MNLDNFVWDQISKYFRNKPHIILSFHLIRLTFTERPSRNYFQTLETIKNQIQTVYKLIIILG